MLSSCLFLLTAPQHCVPLGKTWSRRSRLNKEAGEAETPVGENLRHDQQAAVDQPEEEMGATVLGHSEGKRRAIVERSADVRKLALKQSAREITEQWLRHVC